MENLLEIIKSEKGNDLALVNTCKYRHTRQRNDGKVKWRCIHKTCTASILTDSKHTILFILIYIYTLKIIRYTFLWYVVINEI